MTHHHMAGNSRQTAGRNFSNTMRLLLAIGLRQRGIKNEHELKYILRFQASGITGNGRGCAEYAEIEAGNYKTDQETMMENLSEYDYEGRQFHQERIDALENVIRYFQDIACEIYKLDNPYDVIDRMEYE